MQKEVVVVELKRLTDQHGGILKPQTVVEAAKAKSSPLHSYFEWNEGRAAAKYRLWQARNLIQVCVEYVGPPRDQRKMDVFVSLPEDRRAGGYRMMVDVLRDKELRASMLDDALRELNRIKEKYSSLKALEGVFAEIKKLNQRPASRKAA